MTSTGSPSDIYAETLAVFDRTDHPREPLTTPEVAESLGCNRRTVYKRLETLVTREKLKTKKVGAGARVWWPADDPTQRSAPSEPVTERSAHPTPDHSTRDSIRVLHVDDESSSAELVAEHLESEGDRIETITATSVTAGLTVLADQRIDCIVSDYEMPEKNGIDFLKIVRTEHGDVPFILFTGTGSEEIAAEAIEAGVDSYLRKKEHGTDQYTSLATRIQTHVDQHRERARADRLEEEYSIIAETASDAFWVFDPVTETVRWDGLECFGYDATSIGPDLDWWADRLHPDDRERMVQFNEALLTRDETVFTELTAERGRFSTEYRFQRADGAYAHCVGRGTILFEEGAPVKLVGTLTDITEQKARERELREERAFIDQTLDTLTDIFYVVGQDGEMRRWNDRIEEVTGYSDEEIAAMRAVDFFPEDERTRITGAIEETLATGSATVEADVLTSEGDRVPYEFTGARLSDVDGNLSGIVGIGRDITANKEYERELQRERDRFGAIFEKAFDAMVIADDDGQYIDVNESATELFGLPEEELLGRSIPEFAPDEFDFQAAWQEFQASEAERGTFPLVRPDGTERVVEYAATRNIVPGQHLSVLRDITERNEREDQLRETTARLEALYENSPDMIDVLDPDGRILDVNRRFCEELEYTEDELLGRPIWEIDQLVDADAVHSLLADFTVGERRKFDGLYECRDGSTVPVEVHLLRLALTGEDRFLAISRDITERKAYERSLEQQNERLDDFASIVSHDLRNPLNVAEGHLELVRDECDSEHLDEISGAIDRSLVLIDDVLTLAREGEAVSETESVDIADVVETCWGSVATGEATLTVATDQMVRADRSRLQQLLENLVRNAIDHGGAGVTVTVGELDDGTGFYVADDGPGIPEDERDHVFESGYSTSTEGTGLGLSIVAEIVTAHGWEIRVTESNDGGARFEITGSAFEVE